MWINSLIFKGCLEIEIVEILTSLVIISQIDFTVISNFLESPTKTYSLGLRLYHCPLIRSIKWPVFNTLKRTMISFEFVLRMMG